MSSLSNELNFMKFGFKSNEQLKKEVRKRKS